MPDLTPGQEIRYLVEGVRKAIRKGVRRDNLTLEEVAVWAGRRRQTVHNWTRTAKATTPDVGAFLRLCRDSKGSVRDELIDVLQKVMPELEVVEPVGSEDASAGAL